MLHHDMRNNNDDGIIGPDQKDENVQDDDEEFDMTDFAQEMDDEEGNLTKENNVDVIDLSQESDDDDDNDNNLAKEDNADVVDLSYETDDDEIDVIDLSQEMDDGDQGNGKMKDTQWNVITRAKRSFDEYTHGTSCEKLQGSGVLEAAIQASKKMRLVGK